MPPQSATPPAGTASPAARVVWEPSEQGETLLAMLFPHLAGLRVHRVEDHALMEALLAQDGPEGFAAAWLRARGFAEAAVADPLLQRAATLSGR